MILCQQLSVRTSFRMNSHTLGRFRVFLGGGLGNRLEALASIAVLAARAKVHVDVEWRRTADCGGAFGDLFENQPCSYIQITGGDGWITTDSTLHSGADFQAAAAQGGHRIFRAFKPIGADLLGWPALNQEMQAYLRQLRPSSEIAQQVTTEPGLPALQIRSTDHFVASLCAPTWIYEKLAERLHQPFLLACDDPSIAAAFAAQFSGLIRTAPSLLATSASRDSVKGAQLALADMLSLSRSSVLFAPPSSTFSLSSSRFGTCRRVEVSILDPSCIPKLWNLVGLHVTRCPGRRWQPLFRAGRLQAGHARLAALAANLLTSHWFQRCLKRLLEVRCRHLLEHWVKETSRT
jgi:hypothetical protein